MPDETMNDHLRLATLEKVAGYTVGIAVNANTGVGTGILAADERHRYILTAAHVVDGIDTANMRFWFRPPAAMVEMAARDTTNEQVGRMTPGIPVPVLDILMDRQKDVAVLKIADSFILPSGAEFYELWKSFEFSLWPEHLLDDISLFMFGFPVANARPLETIGNNTVHFLGAASHLTHYSKQLNATGFVGLPPAYSSSKDFLLNYEGYVDGMTPHGFSGCGVWVATDYPHRHIWCADPVLIGVAHTYFPRRQILAATKLRAIVHITPK